MDCLAMAKQLLLFKTPAKFHRTTLEFPKACVIADAARRFIADGWEWTHLPFGEYRPDSTGARLKRMGVTAGWPDYLFMSPAGLSHWIELKRDGQKRTPDQVRIGDFLERGGCPYLWSSNVGEILTTLQAWGALKSSARF